ncbi:sigma-54 interaction domain-containing protein [Pseudoalteromonas ruthenica]|uniref:sigma-54 interaction domain-containing protein n=1 Tax=Pseudoalteromonas ruthenica TaxID=151081 RepID=UPI00034760DC|nr:sigma-54 dependent transcriptional regulator [Pseudoalteromonas ruthenica]
MHQVKMFVQLSDPELVSKLAKLEVLKKFQLVYANEFEPWEAQVAQSGCDIALVELEEFNEQGYNTLNDTDALSHVEFLFLSKGKPNPYLDKLMRDGAGFHCRAPYDLELISETLQDSYELFGEASQSSKAVESSDLDQFGLLVGSSKSMHKLYRTIRKVARTDANVMIIGESGVGKELVANTVHIAGEKPQAPFVAINCGALSPELIDSELFGHVKGAFTGAHRDHQGVFDQAKGGTLFLDEVTEMPLEQQVKLLRVLESGEYRAVGSQQVKHADVRIVCATNRNPQQAIDDGIFREDLYFRLAHFPIRVPPLRDRGNDVTGLAEHFLAYRNAQELSHKRIATDALSRIAAYNWPGNVRELKHTIERAMILADDVIKAEHLSLGESVSKSDSNSVDIPTGVSLEALEKAAILKNLEENAGNKTDTAEQLGVSVKTLYNKLEKYSQD